MISYSPRMKCRCKLCHFSIGQFPMNLRPHHTKGASIDEQGALRAANVGGLTRKKPERRWNRRAVEELPGKLYNTVNEISLHERTADCEFTGGSRGERSSRQDKASDALRG